jgi:hypothetical protein
MAGTPLFRHAHLTGVSGAVVVAWSGAALLSGCAGALASDQLGAERSSMRDWASVANAPSPPATPTQATPPTPFAPPIEFLDAHGVRSRIAAAVRVRPLGEHRRAVVSAWIHAALLAYPEKLRTNLVRRVYVAADLFLADVAVGGFADRDRRDLYLAVGEGARTDTQRGVHHELAHLIVHAHRSRFDRHSWLAANAPGFLYLGTPVDVVRRRGHSAGTLRSELMQDGVLSEYGRTSMLEDIATFAELMFEPDSPLWQACEQHPRVRAKAAVLLRFYGERGVCARVPSRLAEAFGPVHAELPTHGSDGAREAGDR